MIKNTAGQKIGAQMVSAVDGSAFTGSVTANVTGDAGTQAAGSVGSGACTHEGNGFHTYAPAQAETNYDHIAFTFVGSGAIPATVQVFTIAGDAFTRLGAPAGASVSADVAAVKAETATILSDTNDIQTRLPAALVSGRIDASVGAMAADVMTAAAAAADLTTELQSGLATAAELAKVPKSDSTVTWNATALASIQQEATDALNAYDPPTSAEMDARTLVAASYATAAGVSALNNLSAAQVNAEVDAALVDIHLDHLLAATYDPASKPGAADALLNEIVESDAGVSRFTANALELSPTGGSAPTAAAIADAVWDEALSGHATAGSTGEALSAAGSAGDPWITTLPGSYTGSQAGALLSNVETRLGTPSSFGSGATVAQNLFDIEAQTDDIGAAGAGLTAADDAILTAIGALNNLSSAQAQTAAAAALTAYDPPTKAEVDAAVAPIEVDTQDIQSRLPAALVGGRMDATVDGTGMEAGAIDAILDDTIGDSTLTVRQALRVLVAGMAGKLSGGATTTISIRNIADSANVIVATVDADGNRSAVVVTP